jgi:hypothetical protein
VQAFVDEVERLEEADSLAPLVDAVVAVGSGTTRHT